MKVIYQEPSQQPVGQSQLAKSVEPEATSIFFTESDVVALRMVRSYLTNYDFTSCIHECLERRSELKEIVLTHQDGKSIRDGYIYIEPKFRKELEKEAKKLGMSLQDYIRGIVYSLEQKWSKEQSEKWEAEEKHRHDNRTIGINLIINKELREKLYKKHGNMNDEELRQKVKKDIMSYLNK